MTIGDVCQFTKRHEFTRNRKVLPGGCRLNCWGMYNDAHFALMKADTPRLGTMTSVPNLLLHHIYDLLIMSTPTT